MKKRQTSKTSKESKNSKASPAGRAVSASAIAERLRLTPRRIQQLVGEGLPRIARGKYDVDQVLDWYIARLERQLAGEIDEEGELASRRKEELRLLSTKADLEEIELSRRRRELIALPDVEKTLTDLVVTTKAHILAVPARVAPQLVGLESSPLQAKLAEELKEALTTLSAAAPQV